MSETAYFDANACLGRMCIRAPGAPYTLDGLLAELDHCRISRALVYQARARDLDPRKVNISFAREIAGQPRLAGAAIINPAPYEADRKIEDEVRELIELGFRAFRIYPLYHGVNFSDPRMRPVFALLAEQKLGLWIDYDQLWINFKQLGQHEQRAIDLAAVEQLAVAYPDMPIVIVGAYLNYHTRLFGLFDRCRNVLVETSLLQGFQVIRFICGRWGAARMLFGTGLPAVSPGAARAALAYAEIDDEDRRKIASANLEALLGQPRTPTLPEQPGRSKIMCAVDSGEPLDQLPVYDSHGHIAEAGFDGYLGLTLGRQDATSIVRVIDRVGIRSLVVASWDLGGGDVLPGNLTAWEALEKFPGRFLPLMVVNPNYPEDWDTLVRECFEKRRFFGLKPYPPTQRTAISHPSFRPMLELAQKLSLPILCHFGFEPLAGVSAPEVERLAPRYPKAQFIVAHSGASFRVAEEVIPLAREFDNVYLEINYTSVPFGMPSFLARQAGVEKILFGTDTPMRDPAPIIGWVVYDHLTDEERVKILSANFRALAAKVGYPLA